MEKETKPKTNLRNPYKEKQKRDKKTIVARMSENTNTQLEKIKKQLKKTGVKKPSDADAVKVAFEHYNAQISLL